MIRKCNFRYGDERQAYGVGARYHCGLANAGYCDGEENCPIFQIYVNTCSEKLHEGKNGEKEK